MDRRAVDCVAPPSKQEGFATDSSDAGTLRKSSTYDDDHPFRQISCVSRISAGSANEASISPLLERNVRKLGVNAGPAKESEAAYNGMLGVVEGNQNCSRGASTSSMNASTLEESSLEANTLEATPSAISADFSFEICRLEDRVEDISLEPSSILGDEKRSAESLWNEQVIRETMVEPPSLPLRLIGAFSGKKRENQRIEQKEIAAALDAGCENDVVMFQAPNSLRNEEFDDPRCVPVVEFDMLQEASTSQSEEPRGDTLQSRSKTETTRTGTQDGQNNNLHDADLEQIDDTYQAPNNGISLPFWGRRPAGFKKPPDESTQAEESLSESVISPCSTNDQKGSFSMSRDGYEEFLQNSHEAVSPRTQRVPGHGPAFLSRGDSALDF